MQWEARGRRGEELGEAVEAQKLYLKFPEFFRTHL